MNTKTFKITVFLIALAFAAFFIATIVPALIMDFDILGAFAAGFVNPYSSGYSVDVIACWLILLVWIVYEKKALNIRYGWVCLMLGIVPGVAVGFAAYLILRLNQFSKDGETNV
jgi:hypothetical protein